MAHIGRLPTLNNIAQAPDYQSTKKTRVENWNARQIIGIFEKWAPWTRSLNVPKRSFSEIIELKFGKKLQYTLCILTLF